MTYNEKDECLNCGAHFIEPHSPECPVFKHEERIICGDCLRPACAGCL